MSAFGRQRTFWSKPLTTQSGHLKTCIQPPSIEKQQKPMLSITDLEKTLTDTLVASDEPVVISIKAPWGEGKTHFWKEYSSRILKSDRPGYVSVFGHASLTDIRQRVIIEAISKPTFSKNSWVNRISNMWTLCSNRSGKLKFVLDFIARLVSMIGLKWPNYLGAIFSPSSLSIQLLEDSTIKKGWVLCLDDIERLSPSIKIEELLGYINELKDEKCCKVILIYNDNELSKNKKTFNAYSEKVIDRNMPFLPNTNYIIKMVFCDLEIFLKDKFQLEEVENKCNILDLKNIRLLVKTKNYFLQFSRALPDGGDAKFLVDRFSSILLFVWSQYSNVSSDYAKLERIEKYNEVAFSLNQRELEGSPVDKSDGSDGDDSTLMELLRKYGYAQTDEIDKILIKFVQTDILDLQALQQHYSSFSEENEKSLLQNKFRSVWQELYHGTLKDNAEEFCSALIEVTSEYMAIIPISSLDSALSVLSKLGKEESASKLLDKYISDHGEKITGRATDFLISPLKYTPLINFFDEIKKNEIRDTRSIGEVFVKIRDGGHVSEMERKRLEEFSAQELASFAMDSDMPHLTSLIQMLKKYNVANIGEVIEIIAESSEMSKMRMMGMGLISE
ncbi:MAG: hypothetical protein ACI9N9_001095 [Enterobacterales bacterium]|jgi:hypothetical protein